MSLLKACSLCVTVNGEVTCPTNTWWWARPLEPLFVLDTLAPSGCLCHVFGVPALAGIRAWPSRWLVVDALSPACLLHLLGECFPGLVRPLPNWPPRID